MSATSVVLRGQAAAERLMVDMCTVTRVTSHVTDPETGVITPTLATLYTGAVKVQQRSMMARPNEVGQAEVFVGRLELHFPVTATGLLADDKVTITASRNPDLVGRVFHLREQQVGTWRSALRFEAVQVVS